MFIKLDRIESKITNWVKRATAKNDDYRPVMQGIHINGSIIGVDGHRLHAVPSTRVPALNESLDSHSTVIMPTIRAGENVVEPEFVVGDFPDYMGVLPMGEPTISIGVDPKFMIDALRDMDKEQTVRITIYAPESPIEVFGRIDDNPTYALIMPKHLSDGDGVTQLYWRPDRAP